MAGAPPPVGYVRIETTDPPLEVTALLGEDQPVLAEGWGGWESVERPRRAPLTHWQGPPARELELSLLLDGWASGVSIEDQIHAIEKMARPTASDGEPPQVSVTATGKAVPGQALTWVVGSLDWGDALMNESGDRVRQGLSLTLLEFVEDVYLQERSAANRRRRKAQAKKTKRGAAKKRVRAKKGRRSGEDLLSMAARELGDANRWVEIAELNGIRDPRSIKEGQELRLP